MGQPAGGGRDTSSPLISGSFSGTGQSAVRPFLGYFNVSIFGTFSGTVDIEKSFDNGANWLKVSVNASGSPASYTNPVSVIVLEPESQVLYRLNCTTYTSGTINYRVSQSPSSAKAYGF